MATPTHTNPGQLSRYSAVSNLLNSFSGAESKASEAISQHTAPLGLRSSEQIGLHYLEIPTLNSQDQLKINHASAPHDKDVEAVRTTRERAIARLATVIKSDRTQTVDNTHTQRL